MFRQILFSFFLLLMMAVPQCIQAQSPAKYWIRFKDKAGTPYSVQHPEEFLSPRAIELRQKHGIAIDETDLPVNPDYIRQVLATDSANRLCVQSRWLNAVTVYVENPQAVMAILELPFVVEMERTIRMSQPEADTLPAVRYSSKAKPACHYYSDVRLWKDFNYGKSKEQIWMTNVHWLHRMGFRGEGMRMMVLDGGFRNADTLGFFKRMRKDHRLLGARNMVMASDNMFRTATHGTSVLSCIASYKPGVLVGTAPMAQFYLCQTEDGRTENKVEEDNWVAGIELADSLGCQILNSSLGYTVFDDSTQMRSYEDMDGTVSRASMAASIAVSKGMIVCNSAGNEGAKDWKHIGAPADAKGILTVGAVDSKGEHAFFSSIGPAADGRVKPDVCAVGFGTWTANAGGGVSKSSGTSFSSPLMAGMVTCLWKAFPERSNVEVMEAVRESGSRHYMPDEQIGYGIPDFLKAYNALRQPAPNYNITFDSFVAKENVIRLHVGAENKPYVALPKQIARKVHSPRIEYENGLYHVTVELPPLPKSKHYRVMDLAVQIGNEMFFYTIAQE